MQKFMDQVRKFNEMYALPSNDTPTFLSLDKIKNFKSILSEELDEIDDIVKMLESGKSDMTALVAMSDLLGDLVVYCFTMARQFGLPMPEILDIIMESNFSKLGEDGKPIYDERGKVMKGPKYWKPEPGIAQVIKQRLPKGDQ